MPARPSTLAQQAEGSRSATIALKEFWQRRRLLLLSAVLFAGTLLLYGPVVSHQFINLDDDQYVTRNPHVTAGLTAEGFRWAFHTFEMGNWHPLAWLSHMLDCSIFGLNPAGHHYSSVLLHALNAVLLFLLFARATGAVGCSFVVAALFAVHPLNVESVAWVAERKTLISTLFTFLTFGAYGWYARSVPNLPESGRLGAPAARSWPRYLIALAFFVLALMGKPMAVTVPVVLLLMDYWPLRPSKPTAGLPGTPQWFGGPEAPSPTKAPAPDETAARPGLWRLAIEKIPFLLVSLVFSGLAVIAQHSTGSLALALPLERRLQNAAVAYWAYIGKAVWPVRLSIFYPYAKSAPSWTWPGLALLLLIAIAVLSLRLRRHRYLAAGWLFFLVTLLPVIGILQVGNQAMADRYAYTPLIGLFVAAVWGLDALRRRLRLSAAPAALAALCTLAALAWVTRSTLSHWQNSLTLFTHAQQMSANPDELIETNLGAAYNAAGQAEEALRHFKIAKALDPHCYLALYNIGSYLVEHGRPAESIPEFQASIQYSGSRQNTLFAHANLGEAYLLLGDNAQAERAFAGALRLDPNSFVALLGRGQALLRMKRYSEAETEFARALRGRPQPELFYLLGVALEGEQRFDLALEAYTQALRLAPGMPPAQARLSELRKRIPPASGLAH